MMTFSPNNMKDTKNNNNNNHRSAGINELPQLAIRVIRSVWHLHAIPVVTTHLIHNRLRNLTLARLHRVIQYVLLVISVINIVPLES
jgi:hypothetical protein